MWMCWNDWSIKCRLWIPALEFVWRHSRPVYDIRRVRFINLVKCKTPLVTWSQHEGNRLKACVQKWARASTEEIIASISLFVLQKKCTIQQSYDIQTAKQEHFHLNQETGTWQQQPANLHTPTFDPHQEETHVLHSSDVMEVRHFTKVLLGISSSRLGKQERESEDERPTRFWHHALQTLK